MILRAVKKSIQKEEVNAELAELPPFVQKGGGCDFIREWRNLCWTFPGVLYPISGIRNNALQSEAESS